MRILYVEDNPANVFLVRRVAKAGQHDVIDYRDGDEVLKKFDAIKPDLILMDVQLSSQMNGLDVVRALRERGVTTPIIAVTAYAMVGDRERTIEAGCDVYLPKPLPVPRLLALFDQYDPAQQVEPTDDEDPQPEEDATSPSLVTAAKAADDTPPDEKPGEDDANETSTEEQESKPITLSVEDAPAHHDDTPSTKPSADNSSATDPTIPLKN